MSNTILSLLRPKTPLELSKSKRQLWTRIARNILLERNRRGESIESLLESFEKNRKENQDD